MKVFNMLNAEKFWSNIQLLFLEIMERCGGKVESRKSVIRCT